MIAQYPKWDDGLHLLLFQLSTKNILKAFDLGWGIYGWGVFISESPTGQLQFAVADALPRKGCPSIFSTSPIWKSHRNAFSRRKESDDTLFLPVRAQPGVKKETGCVLKLVEGGGGSGRDIRKSSLLAFPPSAARWWRRFRPTILWESEVDLTDSGRFYWDSCCFDGKGRLVLLTGQEALPLPPPTLQRTVQVPPLEEEDQYSDRMVEINGATYMLKWDEKEKTLTFNEIDIDMLWIGLNKKHKLAILRRFLRT